MGTRFVFAFVLAAGPPLVSCSSPTTANQAQAAAASDGVGDSAAASDVRAVSDGGGDANEGGVCGPPVFTICSDGQIFAILAAESQAHLDLANAVRSRLESGAALDFAEKIITDDSVLEVEVSGEVRETGIDPAPGGIDRQIAAESGDDIQSLAGESGATLDASYLDREMLSHFRALGLIDRLLLPSVHDPRVGDLLARIRGVVSAHAQVVAVAQAQIEGSCGSIVAR